MREQPGGIELFAQKRAHPSRDGSDHHSAMRYHPLGILGQWWRIHGRPGVEMESNQGEVIGIAVRKASRAPMQEADRMEVTRERGFSGDFRGASGPRQVTVVSAEAWDDACRELGRDLPWTDRRANLCVKGIQLEHSQDAVLRIGDVVLCVTGETDPCSRMDEAASGLCRALKPDWRGGVCCRVIQGGTIAKGDPILMERPSPCD